jgi:hypothetical protein
MRTVEQKLATKLRKAAERAAHRDKVFALYPANVRYAKAKFKKGWQESKTQACQDSSWPAIEKPLSDCILRGALFYWHYLTLFTAEYACPLSLLLY